MEEAMTHAPENVDLILLAAEVKDAKGDLEGACSSLRELRLFMPKSRLYLLLIFFRY